MTFEIVPLDMALAELPLPPEMRSTLMHGVSLKDAVEDQITAVSLVVKAPETRVRSRLIKATGCKTLQKADADDLHECLRVLRAWLTDPVSFKPPVQPDRRQRPSGMGQLPVPRTVKWAVEEGSCGLCADPVKAGAVIGRMRSPKDRRYAAMGWLCQHCLYDRRDQPRRRDVILRIFHHLFAGGGVNLNASECEVLHTWLAEDPIIARTKAWEKDPLEATMVRLRTSTLEDKDTTWLAFPTGRTILTALHEAKDRAVVSPQEKEVLIAVAQHVQEWETNPSGVEARKYGAGSDFRRQVLAVTPHPTVLSVRGGPFDLHHAPASTEESDGADGG